MAGTGNGSNDVLSLELTEDLQREEIVTRYEYNLKTAHFVIELNHNYENKKISSPLGSSWPKTAESLEKELKRRGVKQEHIRMLCNVADNNAEDILGRIREVEEELENNKKTSKKRERYIQKYRGDNFLAEAVIVEGIPFFTTNNDGTITLEESIEEYGETFLPPTHRMYMSRPYVFKSKQEFDEMVERAKTETLDSFYTEVKSLWNKYSAADDNEISLCSMDTVYSYMQDILGMTHYLFFVGPPEAGKSNRLLVFNILAYRNMMSADMTHSNIYRFLGSIQEGQGTICEDEADDLDESPDKMRIYKVGYTTGFRVPRNDEDLSHGRTQDAYCTFCFKVFAAEKTVKAKGFRERIIELNCQAGNPRFDISEITNPAQEEEFEHQLSELYTLRNRLLLFRLLHYKDKIPNLKLNIGNREKQLFKPVLRLFQNTKTFEQILPVITHFVRERRRQNVDTLHAFLYRVIKQMTTKDGYQLETGLIWKTIKESSPGSDISHRPLSYESEEFGKISQPQITEILMTHFSADRPKHTGKKKEVVFKEDILKRLDTKYNVNLEVTVSLESDESHESDVGLNGYISQEILDDEIQEAHDNLTEDFTEISENTNGNDEKDTSYEAAKMSSNTNSPTQATQATQSDTMYFSPLDSKPPPALTDEGNNE